MSYVSWVNIRNQLRDVSYVIWKMCAMSINVLCQLGNVLSAANNQYHLGDMPVGNLVVIYGWLANI